MNSKLHENIKNHSLGLQIDAIKAFKKISRRGFSNINRANMQRGEKKNRFIALQKGAKGRRLCKAIRGGKRSFLES